MMHKLETRFKDESKCTSWTARESKTCSYSQGNNTASKCLHSSRAGAIINHMV
jgi:hypothetical protein